ncbi:metallophosphoesterase [Hyalangium versicolor]|uniref:metallophosphoesterase n=1 Tax=Hyalangium versicolor TaxID=2861190 RepID=UPI001CCAD677|nr:metallophosphoesterase [Hyalangium versicolor]
MARFGWLHLSDLHLGAPGSGLLQPETREAFEQDLRRLHEKSGPWDVVFISGDLTESGRTREFDLVNSTLGSLWEYLRSLGSDPCLLAVPGDHDIWQVPLKNERLFEQHTAFSLRQVIRGAVSDEKTAQSLWEVFTPFTQWFNKWRGAHPSASLKAFQRGLLPGDFVATIEAQGMSVGVAGLNSLFRSSEKEGLVGLREVDLQQVEGAMGRDVQGWMEQHELVFLLTHHAPSRLNAKPLAELGMKLTPAGSVLLHLCGGRQSLEERTVDFRRQPWTLALRGPSLLSGKLPGLWGYTVGEIAGAGTEGQIKISPRYVSERKGVIVFGAASGAAQPVSDELVFPIAGLLKERALASLEGVTEGVRAVAPVLGPGLAAQRNDELPRLSAAEPVVPWSKPPPGVMLQGVLGTGGQEVGWLAWAPSGEALAIGFSRGMIAYWSLSAGLPRWTIRAHPKELVDLCFSPDSQMIASRSYSDVRLWRTDGTRVKTPRPLQERGSLAAWSSSGLLVTDWGPGALQIWDSRTWAEAGRVALGRDSALVLALAWSPDGQLLACGGRGPANVNFIRAQPAAGGESYSFERAGFIWTKADVIDMAWHPNSRMLAIASRDKTVRILGLSDAWDELAFLEGHTDVVTSVAFSWDGRLLASMSLDGTVLLWRTDTWEEVARLAEPAGRLPYAGLAFSPTQDVLATMGPGGASVRLWDLDVDILLRTPVVAETVHEVSAKVVLVGEGRTGKSCLALRMVQDQYEEMESTHGMRFWSMPLEQAGSVNSAAGTRREVVLWDLGGQSEYQLVHQLFLRDSTVALMVMEPGRGERALEEIEGWHRRLLAQARERKIRKLLVGTKVDTSEAPVNRAALQELVQRLEFESYVLTSARQGQGIQELKNALDKAIEWETLEKVSRPELFQRIRQLIQKLRDSRRVVLRFIELESELQREMGDSFDRGALQAVVSHLTRQGRVADTRMAGGTRVLILEVEQIERYAGSLIVAARENPQGVPAIEVAKVLSPRMEFPRIKPEERLPEDQELPVLNCVIELLIEHGLCLRHQGLLVFPSLFQPTHAESGADFSHAISLHYDFFGPIDNIYASLITSLAVSQRFGPMRLWENRAEFGQPGVDSSGVRRVRNLSQGVRGIAQLDVYFDEGTDSKTRDLFVNFVEQHLRENGVELLERLTVTCVCGKVFSEDVIRKRLSEGKADIGCDVCDRRTPLTQGAQQSRESNPALVQEVQALRTAIREQRIQTAAEVKVIMSGEANVKQPQHEPIRILHLSDLHIGAGEDPISLIQPLAADLRDREEGLGLERLDYLVISGDLTNRASPQEFDAAYEFVSGLIKEFEFTAQRCIIVPGNHDLDWDTDVYAWKKKRQVDVRQLAHGSFREAGDGYNIRDDARYPERFKNFSEHFYHRLMQKPYPLLPEEQGLPFLFAEERLQFLAMNSAWEIDEYFRERSSISEKALARGLAAADQELARAQSDGRLAKDARILRIAVWHHPITGNEKIQDDAFMGRLQASFRLCLHGHVHEERADLVNYVDPQRRIHVVGAGSFGAPTHERPESVPRLYNLLEVSRDLQQVRVHTRSRRKQGGAWDGWAVWKGQGRGEKRSFYDVPLLDLPK